MATAAAAVALSAGVMLSGGCARNLGRVRPGPGQVRVEVVGVGVDSDSGAHYVLLEDARGLRRLQIVIGDEEARAIMLAMDRIKPERPLTHDLLRDLIERTGNRLDRVVITGVRDSVYYADIYFNRSRLRLDSRPSDAIALATGLGAPIYVAAELLQGPPRPIPAHGNLPPTVAAQGIVVQDLGPALNRYFEVPAPGGVLVADVCGGAARAGLMRGDVVTAVNRRPVRSVAGFAAAMAQSADAWAILSVIRGRETRTIRVAERREDRANR